MKSKTISSTTRITSVFSAIELVGPGLKETQDSLLSLVNGTDKHLHQFKSRGDAEKKTLGLIGGLR